MSTLSIGRGWAVVTADGKRVGDVTEVHGHYLLVSRGLFRVKDYYLPLGSVDRAENNTVTLSVTDATLRTMNLSHPPPPPPEPAEPLHDPEPTYEPSYDYDQAGASEPIAFPGSWEGGDTLPYDESPSYGKPQPNGLVEVEVGLNVAFQDLGYGQAILLVPGWPFDSTLWEPLPIVLAEEYRVVTFDPRGLGGSDRPWDFYSVEMTAHDLHRLAVEQALRDVTVVAWSGAALSALLYARDHRARVARVVLLAPLIPLWLADPDAGARYGAEPVLDSAGQRAWTEQLLDDRAGLFDRLVDHLTHRPLSGPHRQWLWQRLMQGAPHAQRKNWEALCAYDPVDLLPEVQAPVTIISAEHDRFSPPALGARLAELLPRAQCLTVSDCGHAIFLEQRDAVVAALRDLLNTYSPEPEEPPSADGAETASEVDSETAAEVDPTGQPAAAAGAAPGEPLPAPE